MSGIIEFAFAGRTHPREVASGDRYAVVATPTGMLVAVVDGQGHGPEASAASALAVSTIEQHARTDMITSLTQRCHAARQRTRGASMSLATFDARKATVTWLGVGDVQARLVTGHTTNPLRAQQHLILSTGTVGRNLPPLNPVVTGIRRGDLLIFATDGIDQDFAEGVDTDDSIGEIAGHILATHGKSTNDALTVVVRYLG